MPFDIFASFECSLFMNTNEDKSVPAPTPDRVTRKDTKEGRQGSAPYLLCTTPIARPSWTHGITTAALSATKDTSSGLGLLLFIVWISLAKFSSITKIKLQ
jgi:hypothetical protein